MAAAAAALSDLTGMAAACLGRLPPGVSGPGRGPQNRQARKFIDKRSFSIRQFCCRIAPGLAGGSISREGEGVAGMKSGPLNQAWSICLLYDLIGALLLGISVCVFAVNAKFAPGGVTGLAVIANRLFRLPIGMATLLINIPILLFTFKRLGWKFFVVSIKTMVICAVFLDHITIRLPVYTGARLWASIFSGICAGIGYSLIFNAGSSTGGTDFIIVAVKQWNDRLSFGFLAFVIDGMVILLSIFVFQDIWSFFYGLCYTIVTSIALDMTTKCIGKLEHGRQNRKRLPDKEQ